MKKPHQHFIPRTYLKKFAHTQDGDTFLVDAFNKQTMQTKASMSVADICVETDLYTLKHLEGDQKYEIENFFSDNIESKYPDIYRLLVVEKRKTITPEERRFILYTTLSMFFRTPKVLNRFVAFSANLIEQVRNETESDTLDFLGYQIQVKGKSFSEIRKEIRETNRINFIKTQMTLLNEFVKFKALDGFVVIELVGEHEFITSDNPVEIGNSIGTGFNLFDARNSIYVPLDPKHALFIAPNLEESVVDRVFYQRDNFIQHVVLNHSTFENAERWIIGTKNGIERFHKDKEQYAQLADENDPLVVKAKTKLELMMKLLSLVEKGISNDNHELIEFAKGLRKHELYEESVEFHDFYRQMSELGINL